MKTNTSPLELLTSDNYADWSVKMKNNLLAQGLWDIVEIGSEPSKPDDDVVEYEAWRKINDAALHAIQSSCGMDILSQINTISSAKIAWERLAEMFRELWQVSGSGRDMSTGTGANQRVESGNSSDNQDRSNSLNISRILQDNLIQTEDDKGNSSSSNNTVPEREDDYATLVKAVRSGDWGTTRDFLGAHPGALTAKILVTGGTVLHAAVDAEQEHIVKELVNMISEPDLAMQDDYGNTALHVVSTSGNYRMAEWLITNNKSLVRIIDQANTELPVTLAMACGHKDLALYLYSQTPLEDLEPEQGRHGASLLNRSIYNRDLGMALLLMERCPRLAFALDQRDISPLEALAVSTEAFESENRLVFWKRWIYNHCIHISLACAADQFRLDIQNYQEKTIGSVQADHLWHQLVSSLSNLLGFKRLYEMKLLRLQFKLLLFRICGVIAANNKLPKNVRLHGISKAIHRAISRGNLEFINHILKANSSFLWINCGAKGRSILHGAVMHRQHMIFSLIYNFKKKNALLYRVDESRNTILHMVGKLTKNTPIDHIRGAALQMQREVQWFKGVERICPLSFKERLNKRGLTPRQVFTRNHQKLRKEGERWMKDTATSCTVVGALIITIMFAAAFTIPGGNNQDTGLPILVHDKLFTLFLVSDSVSLFSSSTSVLMFLGILTSRYTEEDFLISLPRKMIIGLFALFFSIATMMIAFSAALLLMLRGKFWIVVPVIGLAGIPILLFVLMQFRLLIDMLVSTYGSGIFDRKMKSWF